MKDDKRVGRITDAILVESLRFKYPTGDDVLHDINFTIHQGEIVGICGPTGAGKTTLCMCLKGLIPHTQAGRMSGRVIVHGKDTRTLEPGVLAETIGMVLQDPEVQILGLTVEEDLAFGPENLEVPREKILARIPDILHLVRLNGYEKRETYSLSGGEKQRVAIAGALMMQPRILILDEPTSELDPIGKSEVLQVLDDLRREHEMTIIIVEHDLDRIAEMADRIIVMDQGKVVADQPPRSLFKNIALFQTTGGERPPQVADLLDRLARDGFIPEDQITPYEEEALQVLIDLIKAHRYQNGVKKVEQPQSFENQDVIISVDDISYRYEESRTDQDALEDVSLKIRDGEFLAFVGQNGAGKSTLAKHFNGTLKPSHGSVKVLGKDTQRFDVDELAYDVGYCYQNPDHQIFASTVYEEVAFGPRNLGLKGQELKDRVLNTLETVGLASRKDVYPFLLGRAERQLLAVSSVIAMGVRVLVVDEPTTGMDLRGARDIMGLLTEWNERGTTVIVITHDMNLIAEYVPRIVVLTRGKVVCDGPTRDAFSQPDMLAEAYLSPPLISRFARRLSAYGFPSDILTVTEFYEQLRWFFGYSTSNVRDPDNAPMKNRQ